MQKVVGVNAFRPKDEAADRHSQSRQLGGARSADREAEPPQGASATERDVRAALDGALGRRIGGKGNLLDLAVQAARAKATVGEISDALEKVWGRHRAEIKAISGVYKREVGMSDSRRARAAAGGGVRARRRPPPAHPRRQDGPGRPRPRPEGDRLGLRRSRLRRGYRPALRHARRRRRARRSRTTCTSSASPRSPPAT